MFMKIGITTALVTAFAVSSVASPAMAQSNSKYYARERIVGVPLSGANAGQPSVEQPPAVAKCPSLVKGYISPDPVTVIGSATSVAGAQSICDAARPSKGAGSCTWIAQPGYSDSNQVKWSPNSNVTLWTYNSNVFWAASCK